MECVTPPRHWPATQVLGICQLLAHEFTLTEIVSRITAERPDIIHQFADAWSTLLGSRHIRICTLGDVTTYALADAPEGEPPLAGSAWAHGRPCPVLVPNGER